MTEAFSRVPAVSRVYDRHTRSVGAVPAHLGDHVVVIGYGHAGASVAEVLDSVGAPCLVVERDLAQAEEAEAAGHHVLLGDAANSEILKHAHLETARVLVIAISAEASAELIAREARAVAT